MAPMSIDSARKLWANADAYCFDVDSTVCIDEGVDNLAEFCGVADQVKQLTNEAMGGGMSFEESFSRRLKIVNVSREKLRQFTEANPPKFTPGIKELVSELHKRGKHVYLITGGVIQIVQAVADELQIPGDRVIANKMLFDAAGDYAGFDESCFTARSGGKPRAVQHLRQQHSYSTVVMIGDGATDLEARSECHLFVGFGVNVVREKVKSEADWFVTDVSELIRATTAAAA